MLIKSIKLNDYRNYSNYFVNLNPNLNIIIGSNGVGKTNILESVIVVSNTKSFRTLNDIDLIKKGKDYLKIDLNSDINNFKVVINHNSKSLYINDNLIKRTSDYIGKLNAILFKPSDLEIFTAAPSERRKILDLEIGKVNKKYLNALLKYNSLLKDKNKLLKELEIDETLLNVINESMIPQIQLIIQERENFIEIINKYISDIYTRISGANMNIKIEYKKCSNIENIQENIISSKEKDYYYHYATFGVHKEDFNFIIDGYNANSMASQGQKRMILIAFKFTLIKYIQLYAGITPVVLLDDIMSELDKDNQERLLENIPDDMQVIITNTDLQNLNINKNYKLIDLNKEEENV